MDSISSQSHGTADPGASSDIDAMLARINGLVDTQQPERTKEDSQELASKLEQLGEFFPPEPADPGRSAGLGFNVGRAGLQVPLGAR